MVSQQILSFRRKDSESPFPFGYDLRIFFFLSFIFFVFDSPEICNVSDYVSSRKFCIINKQVINESPMAVFHKKDKYV